MGKVLQNLSLGDTVEAIVVEIVDRRDLIVSFRGDLVRVANMTGVRFAVGDRATLSVDSLQPLRFRLSRRSERAPGRFEARA